MNWLLYIPSEGEYHFPSNKQTNKTKHKQTNEHKNHAKHPKYLISYSNQTSQQCIRNFNEGLYFKI